MTMTETRFLLALSKTTGAYNWQVKDNKISGVAKNGKTRGQSFDPLTAVCRSTGNGPYCNSSRGRKNAGKKLGVTTVLVKNVEDATQAKSNRGNCQTLRGKMRQVLGV